MEVGFDDVKNCAFEKNNVSNFPQRIDRKEKILYLLRGDVGLRHRRQLFPDCSEKRESAE